MTWAKLDDAFPEHPKVDRLSDGAFRLHVGAIVWSCRWLTDGYLPPDRVGRMSRTFKTGQVAELIRAGLWEEKGDGWQIHDFLDYQLPAEKVLAKREAEASRMRQKRSRSQQRSGERPGERGTEPAGDVGGMLTGPVPVPVPNPKVNPLATSVDAEPVDNPQSVAVAPSPVDHGFTAFWDEYPRRSGKRIGKAEAERGWKRLSTGERLQALAGVEHYRAACEAAGGPLAMDAHRWLAKKRWEDWQTPATVTPRANGSRSSHLQREGVLPLAEAVALALNGTPALPRGET